MSNKRGQPKTFTKQEFKDFVFEYMEFIYDKQEVKIHCNTNPQPFQYCQPHYLLCWDSISRNYSLFHIQSCISSLNSFPNS